MLPWVLQVACICIDNRGLQHAGQAAACSVAHRALRPGRQPHITEQHRQVCREPSKTWPGYKV